MPQAYDNQGRLKISTTGGVSIVDAKVAITIENPTNSEDVTIFYAKDAIQVSQMSCVLIGTTPSVTWTLRYNSDRSATGTEVVTGGTTTTSSTTGDKITTFNSPYIPAQSWVWLETTAQSGTVTELSLTVNY